MRLGLGVVCALAILIFGALQATAAIALRADASRASLAAIAPPALVRAVEALDPHGYEPEALRRVLGARALARGDLSRADRFARSLRTGPDRSALQGAIAQRRGDEDLAIAGFLAAGDLVRLEATIDAIAARGDDTRALHLQSVTLDALQKTDAQNDTIAEAFYHQALLLQAAAYRANVGTPAGHALEVKSLRSYIRAENLAPLEARYLIALANQHLNLGHFTAARTLFAHLRELDPTSVEAATGLADTAARERAQKRRP